MTFRLGDRRCRSPWGGLKPQPPFRKALATLGVWLALAACAPGRPGLPEKIDTLMRAYEKTQFFSGVVVVAKDGAILYQKAFGLADRLHGTANTLDSRFNIASMGKTFTAVLVMQLVEKGQLELDEPIRSYLPEYPIPNADKITIHHLLTHTSGLSNYMIHPKYDERRRELKTLSDVMPLVCDMPLVFSSPGERFSYSNSGFIVLGRIIEKVTGTPYVSYTGDKLWAPLGMTRTSIDYPPAVNPPAEAIPYYVFSSKSYVDGTLDENPAFSDGGAFSSAPDLFAFARALQAGKLLETETRALMLRPRAALDPQTKYGYGWFVYENLPGGRWVGHSGGGHGYSSDLKLRLDDDYVIVLLANLRTASRRITENIVKLLATGEYDPPRMTLESFLFGEMEERSVRSVLGDLGSALAKRHETKLTSPTTLAGVGDALASLKRFDDALLVHERNVELFPGSPMPHNAMGELYSSMGKKAEAVRSFRMALVIDPKDDYAAMRLKSLAPATPK